MKVSIVIPTYNSEAFIKSTIDSVLLQTYPNIECLVIDGASKDSTIDILRTYGNKITFISEKDKGVFDALNKGIECASGEIIGWMGADDFYATNDVVAKAVRVIQETKVDICWGDLQYVHRDNPEKIVRYWKSSHYNPGFFQKGWQMPHFASFIRKEVFQKYGVFSLKYKIAADYDFFLRILEKERITSIHVPEVFLKMRSGGQSNRSMKNIINGNIECFNAWKNNGLKVNTFRVFLPKPLNKLKQYFTI